MLLLVAAVDVSAARITIALNDRLDSLEVEVSAGAGPLQAQDATAWDDIEILSNGRLGQGMLEPVERHLPVKYRVALRHQGSEWLIAQWHEPLRISDWRHWLLTPTYWSMTRPLRLDLRVPRGGSAILPFQLVQHQPGMASYRAYPILPGHGGAALFGNLSVKQHKLGNTRVVTAVVGDADAPDEVTESWFHQWAEDVFMVAAGVHGATPGDQVTLIIVPVPMLSGTVPWAHVRRGGGSHVIAYVREHVDATALYADWTLYHEMTHLYHPYLHSGGRWISEGFASYFQNIYLARSAHMTPEAAFDRLLAGIERGQSENEERGYRPVTEGGRMRTYWTAAALALDADVRMSRDGAGQTLAAAIGRFAAARMPQQYSWHPRDYLVALDAELDQPLLVSLYDDYRRDRYLPTPEMAPAFWRQVFQGNDKTD